MASRQIVVSLVGDASKFRNTLDGASKDTERFSSKMRKASGIASVAIGGLMVKAFKDGVEGVMEQNTADAKLVDTLSRVPKAVRPSADAIEGYADSMQKSTMFTHENVDATAAFLARQDGVQSAIKNNVGTFQDFTQTSLDLATVLGVDGPAGAALLSKALAAPDKATKTLMRAGVVLTAAEQAKMKAWAKSGDVAKEQAFLMDKLKEKTHGAAKAAGETLPGQLARAKNAFGEVEEGLAAGLMPAITKVLDKALKFTAWAQDNPGKMQAVVAVVGGLAAVLFTVSIATKIWTAATTLASAATKIWAGAQWLLNFAMEANPLGILGVAIVALIAVIVLIATKTDWFQKLWSKAWGLIKSTFSAAFNFIKAHWATILAVLAGPIGIAVLMIVKHFDAIKSGAKTAISNLVTFVKSIPGKIKGAIGDLGRLLVNVGHDLIQGLINGIKDKAGDILGTIKSYVTDKIPGWIKKPLGISSPSKVTRQIGRHIVEGLVLGIGDGTPQVQAFLDTLTDGMKAKLDNAKGLIDTARSVSQGIADALAGKLNAPSDDAGSVLDQLKKQVQDTQKLKTTLKGLAAGGLNKDLLSQLTTLDSLPAAQQLLAGGAASIGTANSYDNAIAHDARSIGNSEALRQTGYGLSGNGQTVVTFAPSGDALVDQLMVILKKYVRVHGGGNVQTAMGR